MHAYFVPAIRRTDLYLYFFIVSDYHYYYTDNDDLCRFILYKNGKVRNLKAHALEFRECGYKWPRSCNPSHATVGPGCYCKNGFLFNPRTGSCDIAAFSCREL